MFKILSLFLFFAFPNLSHANYPQSIASFSLVGRHASDSKNTARLGKIETYNVRSQDVKKCQAMLLWCGTSGVINSPKEFCKLARQSDLKNIKAGGYGTEGFGYGAAGSWELTKNNSMKTEVRIGLGWMSGRIVLVNVEIDGSGEYFKASNIKAEVFGMVADKKGTSKFSKHYSPIEYKRLTSFFDLAITCKK